MRLEVADATVNVKYKEYFEKRDHCETICEKISNRNILPNQFSAALPIFSGPKRGGAELPQIFV